MRAPASASAFVRQARTRGAGGVLDWVRVLGRAAAQGGTALRARMVELIAADDGGWHLGLDCCHASYGGFLYTSTDSGSTWVQRATMERWSDVASSADGRWLVAAADGYTVASFDAGVTWAQLPILARHVAMSADGTTVVVHYDGIVVTRTFGP